MDIGFDNVKQLYDRVFPALKSKVKELHKNKIDYIKEVDVWNCLIEVKWKKTKGLMLSDIVDDILNIDNTIIEQFVKQQMKNIEREVQMDVEFI